MSRLRRDRTYIDFTDPTAVSRTWTDVSPYVSRWTWGYGRQIELDQFQAGTGSFTLANEDHRFDPLLTNGPYGAGLAPMRRFKQEISWNLLTANQASLETDTTGWAAGANTTITRSTTLAQDGVASLRLSSTAAGNVSATTPTGTSGIEVVAGEPLVAMASFRAGASARSCRVDLGWYSTAGVLLSTTTGATVTSATGSWTQATTTAVAPAAGYVAVIVVVQSTAAGAELHYVDQIGVFPADAGTPAWSAGGPWPVAAGFIPTWEPIYSDLNGGTVTVPTYDALALLAQMRLPESMYAVQVAADTPTSWYRLGDDTTTMLDSGSAAKHGTHVATAADGLVPSSTNGARSYDGTVATRSVAAGAVISGSAFSVECWVRFPSTFGFFTNTLVAQGSNGQSTGWLKIAADGTTVRMQLSSTSGSANQLQSVATVALAGDTTYHVVVTRTGNTVAMYLNGVALTVVTTPFGTWSSGNTVFGSTLAIGSEWPDGATGITQDARTVDEVAVYTGVLSAARVLAHYNAGAGYPGEDSGTRIGRVLDDVGWPAADRLIGTGQATVQAAVYGGGNVLGYLQQVAKTEQGRLYADQQGRIVFTSRTSIFQPGASRATFGDGGGSERGYARILPSQTVNRIINRSVAQRVGGALQEAVDATSKGRFYERSESNTDLLCRTDGEAADFAAYRVLRAKNAAVRINGIELRPVGVVDLWDQILGRNIGDRVTVKRRLPDGSVILNGDFILEGVTHDSVVGAEHVTSWYVSAIDPTVYFILDDTTNGVLDTAALAF